MEKMALPDIEIVVLVVSTLGLFAGVLGWASWTESRDTAKKRKTQQARPSRPEPVGSRREMISENR
jgi:hypothetical protein